MNHLVCFIIPGYLCLLPIQFILLSGFFILLPQSLILLSLRFIGIQGFCFLINPLFQLFQFRQASCIGSWRVNRIFHVHGCLE
ncbi:hypothetical protein DW974_06085 [Lachnospiraceae bacterium AM48-27BH]|nr:hypothetical protein DW974_06085 [Lachnospiraceae bacterium AM48-27BH]